VRLFGVVPMFSLNMTARAPASGSGMYTPARARAGAVRRTTLCPPQRTFLETTSNGRIKVPGRVRGTEDENLIAVLADTLHLDLRVAALASCAALATACRTRNSVLMRLDDSFSPSERAPHSESTSSMKMMEGLRSRACEQVRR
jgi:hypothetical protein